MFFTVYALLGGKQGIVFWNKIFWRNEFHFSAFLESINDTESTKRVNLTKIDEKCQKIKFINIIFILLFLWVGKIIA